MRIGLHTLILVLVVAPLGYSQASKKSPAPAKAHKLTSAKKLELLSIGAISPKALIQAPLSTARAANKKGDKDTTRRSVTLSTQGSGVSEFQAVPQGFNIANRDLVLTGESSTKSRLKNIHGEVDGALAQGVAGSNQISAAAGATSKSGKTSIFIRADHTTNRDLESH
jgi:hypothetical protein